MTYPITSQRYIQSLFGVHVEENWNITKKVKKPAKIIVIAEFKPNSKSHCFCLTTKNLDQ